MESDYIVGDGFILRSAPAHHGIHDRFSVLLCNFAKRLEEIVKFCVDTWTHEFGQKWVSILHNLLKRQEQKSKFGHTTGCRKNESIFISAEVTKRMKTA